MSTKRNRHNYPLIIEQGYSCTDVGRRLGINRSNVFRWVMEYRNAEEETTQGGWGQFIVEHVKKVFANEWRDQT